MSSLCRFVDAGLEAQKPCDCRPAEYYDNMDSSVCDPGAWTAADEFECFKANCDWWPYQPGCDEHKTKLSRCPLYDAVVYQSTVSVPGLVYLKDGKGHTVPLFYDSTTRKPFNYSHGSAGRCVNAVCRNTPPPMNGVSELEAGETWCDSVVDWGGMISILESKPSALVLTQ